MTQQHSCLNSGRGIDGSSRFNMASLKINLPQNHKRSRGGGLSRYYSGKARSFKCLNEVHSIEDLKKKQLQQDYNNIVPPPAVAVPVAVAVDAHHHDSNNNNNMNKKKKTFSSSSSSSSPSVVSCPRKTLSNTHCSMPEKKDIKT